MASQSNAELFLVHTPQPATIAFALGATTGYHAVTTMPSTEEVAKAAKKIVDAAKAIAEEKGCTVAGSHTDHGNPAEEITNCAEKWGADLIVTGRRGLGNLGVLIQGSTSQQIGHLAKCSCLSTV